MVWLLMPRPKLQMDLFRLEHSCKAYSMGTQYELDEG